MFSFQWITCGIKRYEKPVDSDIATQVQAILYDVVSLKVPGQVEAKMTKVENNRCTERGGEFMV